MRAFTWRSIYLLNIHHEVIKNHDVRSCKIKQQYQVVPTNSTPPSWSTNDVIQAHLACFGPISALPAPFRDLKSVLGS